MWNSERVKHVVEEKYDILTIKYYEGNEIILYIQIFSCWDLES